MANDVSLSEQQLMEIINQAKSISLGEATEAQKNFAQSVDDRDDPKRTMRSRFERPAMPMPTPTPTPAPAGLMATPRVQEPNEESSMIDVDSIKSYLGNLFSPSAVSPTAIEEPVSRTEVKTRPHPEPEPDGGVAAEPSFDDALIHTIKYYEGEPILKAKKPVKGDPYTIGYGRTRDLEGKPITKNTRITEEQANQMLREDLDTRLQEIKKAYPNFDTYPQDLQLQLTQSYYRGTLTPKASPKTRKLINKGKFQEAAKEFLNNEEYKNAKKLGRPGIIERMDDVALALKNMGDDPVQVAKRSTGGRMASNPNPYPARVI
jgi:GH24 family phage-related lysozyme (muramidase)